MCAGAQADGGESPSPTGVPTVLTGARRATRPPRFVAEPSDARGNGDGYLRLAGRAVAGARSELDGRLVVAVITPEDEQAAGGTDSDGVVEALRGTQGAQVAAVIRQVADGEWRVSTRASGGDIDVSAIAAREGGGGHRAAAGFTSHRPPDEIIALIRQAMLDQGA